MVKGIFEYALWQKLKDQNILRKNLHTVSKLKRKWNACHMPIFCVVLSLRKLTGLTGERAILSEVLQNHLWTPNNVGR